MSIPTSLKPIGHYIKIANEHKTRDPAVYYWCLFYAVQAAMKIDKSSPEAKAYLISLLDLLEQVKKTLNTVEAVTNEMVAEAHLEEYVLKLFVFADKQDRAAVYNKNVVKAFYTAGQLYDVLTLFGDHTLNEKFAEQRKYAKWKAAYIHTCLKNGETPVPGPPGGIQDEDEGGDLEFQVPDTANQMAGMSVQGDPSPSSRQDLPPPPPPPTQASSYVPPTEDDPPPPATTASGVTLTYEHFTKATKHCRSAISAMQYEDAPAAIDQMIMAMRLLQTGKMT